MEGTLNDRTRRQLFRLGVGLLGLTLLVSLGFSQLAYDTHTQASTRARRLQSRLDDFFTVRGKVNGVVEALSGTIPFANPSLAIDQRVWNLQMAWTDFRDDPQHPGSGARFLTPAPSELDAAMDQFALAALRNALALRRNSGGQHEAALQITAGLEPELTAMEHQLADSIKASEARRDSAMTGFHYGRSVAYGAFFALVSLLGTGMLVSAMGNFKEWFGRGSVAAIHPDKLAAPHR